MRRAFAILVLLLAPAAAAFAHEAVDPVCGMTVSTDDARFTATCPSLGRGRS